jgi:hypothetical protein
MRAIVDGKQRSPVICSETLERANTDWAWPDVFDQMCAVRCAVAHPGFEAMDTIVRVKKRSPIAKDCKAKL